MEKCPCHSCTVFTDEETEQAAGVGPCSHWPNGPGAATGSCLKCGFCARQRSAAGSREGVGSQCCHVVCFPTVLLPRKLSPLCGLSTETLEVGSTSKSESSLNAVLFSNNGKPKRQKQLTEGGEIPWNVYGVVPVWGENSEASNNSLL